jgi:hypothetical protein
VFLTRGYHYLRSDFYSNPQYLGRSSNKELEKGMSSAANFIARRSNSSTSLAQFYKENNQNFNPSLANHNGELDFCNAFWGEGDAGYEVISARLRASSRTVDDLKTFWKERFVVLSCGMLMTGHWRRSTWHRTNYRAAIEDDYAKRLAKLAKQTLGKDEVG